jgi:hypothetical protein
MLFDELHRLATVGCFENSGFAFSTCYPRERNARRQRVADVPTIYSKGHDDCIDALQDGRDRT